MADMKTLAKDTAIYGLSSIIGRFLNYLLVPLYTYKIAASSRTCTRTPPSSWSS